MEIKVEIGQEEQKQEIRTVAYVQAAEMELKHNIVVDLLDGDCKKLLDHSTRLQLKFFMNEFMSYLRLTD